MTTNSRVLYISHGGGPLPLLGDAGHKELVARLQAIAAGIAKPSAIIVISAHWEEAVPTITAGARPAIIYDYYGFPEESYQIEYSCPGEPTLAGKLRDVLNQTGMHAKLDKQRGFDHGLFIPLTIMYPKADIPCVQLSLLNTLDPAPHIQMGQALQHLDVDNVLVLGSGFSFHNMKAFFTTATAETEAMNLAFERWLIDTCTNTTLEEEARAQRFLDWEKAPYARYCHPREEHLLPLHVCYGMTQQACSHFYQLRILNQQASMYLW